MIRYLAIEQVHMDSRITDITGRFASLYVYQDTVKVQNYGDCRELHFVRNVTENYVIGPDGWSHGVAMFDESQDPDAIARGKALIDLEESGALLDCCWSRLEGESFAEFPGHPEYLRVSTADRLPHVKLKGFGRGQEALEDALEHLQGNWSEPPLPWDSKGAAS